MFKAQYDQRGAVPQDVIRAVEFRAPVLLTGQALVALLAAPITGFGSGHATEAQPLCEASHCSWFPERSAMPCPIVVPVRQ